MATDMHLNKAPWNKTWKELLRANSSVSMRASVVFTERNYTARKTVLIWSNISAAKSGKESLQINTVFLSTDLSR